MHEIYFIEGTVNIDKEQLEFKEYNDPTFYPLFQEKIHWFKELVESCVNEKKGIVILRVYDGEFNFLKKKCEGNGPIRHFTKKLTDEFVNKFKEGCYKVDYISVQLREKFINEYNDLFPDRPIDFPMDIIYGLTSNLWLLKTFKNRIALIGGCEKLKLIQKMMEYTEYKNYVGNDYFLDYIEVPERFSCDDTDNLIISIGEKIKNSKADLFLFGIGISKMAISWQFKNYKNAVFIDIGCGLSALAGTCGIDRPYYGGWTNYRLKDYNYRKIDQMDFNIENGNVKFLEH